MSSTVSLKPEIKLTPFQKAWIKDGSRFKIAAKARRIGFTFATTLEIARDCIRRQTRWLIVSRTQDTAKEAVREIAKHFQAFQIVERVEDTGLKLDEIKVNKFVIELPNGSEVMAMTAHPDAARGFGGNVFLDEHGFHRDSRELWKGVAPAVMRGHRMIVVSTPHYQSGNYYDLARKAGLTAGKPPEEQQNGIWSTHWVDAYMAAPQLQAIKAPGFEDAGKALAELRELANNEDDWQQEYCCRFLSAAEMWLALELIAAARHPQAVTTWQPEREFEGPLFIGADIGRKRDATQIWIDERIGETAYLRGLITLLRTPFEQQFRVLSELIAHPKVRRASIDASGLGMQLAEQLRQKFGMKAEGVTFTREIKEKMAVMVRRRMEEKLDKIPENAPEIERDFAAIKRETTASGNLRFDADRTENSHADIFWAKALADLAADSGVQAAEAGTAAEDWRQSRSLDFARDDSAEEDRMPSFWDAEREEVGAGLFVR